MMDGRLILNQMMSPRFKLGMTESSLKRLEASFDVMATNTQLILSLNVAFAAFHRVETSCNELVRPEKRKTPSPHVSDHIPSN